jgi:hypothetical protein
MAMWRGAAPAAVGFRHGLGAVLLVTAYPVPNQSLQSRICRLHLLLVWLRFILIAALLIVCGLW